MIRDWTASEPVDGLSVYAEVFFTRLIMKVDDYGNYTANMKLIKSALFPLKDQYTTEQVTGWLNECVAAGLIQPYHAEGKSLIHIKNFDQKLRRMHSVYPQPLNGQQTDTERTSDGQVTDKCPPELEEKRSRREVEHEDAQILDPFDDLWVERNLTMKASLYPGVDLQLELQRFRAKIAAAPQDYLGHDTNGLRKALLYHISHAPKSADTKQPRKKAFEL